MSLSFPDSVEERVLLLRTAAERGDADSQCELGEAYYLWNWVPQDPEEAIRWFRKAVEQGHAWAQYCLGVAYFEWMWVPQDPEEAVRWSLKAAEQGIAEAQINLGLAYLKGEGVPEDREEGMRWLGMVADAERAKAPKDPNDPRYTPPPTYYEDGSGAFVWKYLSPKWRIGRARYAVRIIILCAVMVPGLVLNHHMGKPDLPAALFGFLSLICLYGCFAVTAKRFHDFGTTGWAVLIPFYGFLAPLFVQGYDWDNRYGPRPS